MRRVLKWIVPVDDAPHEIGGGPVMLVECQRDSVEQVTVWTLEDGVSVPRQVQIFGTGHPLPITVMQHIGSAMTRPSGMFVWHVFEIVS